MFRYDEHGKQLGLDWNRLRADEPDEPTVKPVKKPVVKRGSKHVRTGGKCGRGIHDMKEHGRKKKDGTGSYCNGCKNDRAAEYRAAGKQRAYRQRKAAEAKNQAVG